MEVTKELPIFAFAIATLSLLLSQRRKVSKPTPRVKGPAPITLLLGSTAPSIDETLKSKTSEGGGPPLAFECVGDRTIAEHV